MIIHTSFGSDTGKNNDITLTNENHKTSQSKMELETNMMQELMRLASFQSWPDGDNPSPLSLARSGFAYSGQRNKVFCPICKIELDHLKQSDNPEDEHRKRSPGCRLANQVIPVSNSSSRPIRPPPPEASNCALWDVYSSALRRSQDQNRPNEPTPGSSLNLLVRIDRLNPDYELLRRERIRLDTFYDWPSSAHVLPEALAREGFFYTGSVDRVRCAFCHNTLLSWVPDDDPKEEHRKHFPRCPVVLNLDVGNVRIEDDVQAGNSCQNFLSLTGAVRTGASAGLTGAKLPSGEAFMNTPIVRAVLELGFSEENVKQVVQQHLTATGEIFPNAESVIEQLLSMGVSQSFPVHAQMTSASASAVTSASPVGASSSANVTSPAASASNVASTSSIVPVCPGAETEPRSGEERSEETNVPQNEDEKRRNVVAKKRRRGHRKEKVAESVGCGSSSSAAGTAELQAVSAELNSTSVAAATNIPGDESAGLVVDPEEEQLLEENSRLKEARTCKVCMDREVNTVFLPCGHLICCDVCSPKVRNCPLCRTFIRGTVKTYLS